MSRFRASIVLICGFLVSTLLACGMTPSERVGRQEQGLGETVSVDADASTFTAPATVTVHYASLPGNQYDWIAISAAGSPAASYTSWQYVNGATSGSATFANVGAGNWVARVYGNNTFTVLAESAPFTVSLGSATTVSTNKLAYQASESAVVSFAGMAGNTYDWIAIAPQGSPAGSYVRWVYTNGQIAGTASFALSGLDGTYVARAFFNNSFTIAAESAPFAVGTHVTTSASAYAQGTPVSLTYSGLAGNQYDWVAISPAGSPAGAYGPWAYTNGAVNGSAQLNGLTPGSYVARAYENNGFTILAESPVFTVTSSDAGAPPSVSTNQSAYTAPATVNVAFAGLPGNARDWIAISPAGSGAASYVVWGYTQGNFSGNAVFNGVSAGTYVARAYENDGFHILAESAPFTVSVADAGSADSGSGDASVSDASDAGSDATTSVPVVTLEVPYTPGSPVGPHGVTFAQATVSSAYSIQSVTVKVGSAPSAPMTFYSDPGPPVHDYWYGNLNVTGAPYGPTTLVVTAVDVNGNVGTASLQVQIDPPPSIAIASPLNETVIRSGTLDLDVSCIDTGYYGCASITAEIGSVDVPGGSCWNESVVASGTTSIAAAINVAARDGTAVCLHVFATDAGGYRTDVNRVFYVDASPRIYPLTTVNGKILDYGAAYILYLDGTTNHLMARVRATGANVDLSSTATTGALRSLGAIWAGGEWRNGVISSSPATSSVVANGDYAAWGTAASTTATVRNVVAGTDATMVHSYEWLMPASVAPGGDVAVLGSGLDTMLFRWRAGTLSPVHTDWGIGPVIFNPVISDQYLVFGSKDRSTANTRFALYVHDGATVTKIVGPVFGSVLSYDHPEFYLDGAYLAHGDVDANGVRQIFLRNLATGASTQVSNWAWSVARGVSSTGEITFQSGTRFYRTPLGGSAIDVAGAIGTDKFVNGKWLHAVGRTLFALEPTTPDP